jgi:hypothetical protein
MHAISCRRRYTGGGLREECRLAFESRRRQSSIAENTVESPLNRGEHGEQGEGVRNESRASERVVVSIYN